MRLQTEAVQYLTINVKENKPELLINYELLKLSYNNYISKDRGVSTDRYSSTMKFIGNKDYINNIITELNLLRYNQLPILLDQCEEPFFGDHIDHSGVLDVTIFKVDKQQATGLNMYEVSITFLLNDPVFISESGLPTGLQCCYHKWEGYSEWDFVVNETYNRKNYFVDSESDSFEFVGKYLLTNTNTGLLLNYWKYQRGGSFLITESAWGVSNMFGILAGTGPHYVRIKDIKIDRISPRRRDVTINLVKVNEI